MGQAVKRGAMVGGRPTRRTAGAVAWLLSVLIGLLAVAAPSIAAAAQIAVTFDPPTATSTLNVSLDFAEAIHTPTAPARVELLSRLPSDTITQVQLATLTSAGGDTFNATVSLPGHITPNTTFNYRFRVVAVNGFTTLGPDASVTVTDDRFPWKTLQGRIVRLHWYDGSDAFATRALDIGDKAIDQASALLGVKETQPVDFFIYDAEAPFRDALGPGTRENVGGEAIAEIRTLFGLIGPSDIDSSWVDTLVTHELTHLVFNTAVQNPYHEPPRWLNEGLAVFLSQGYGNADKAMVANAAASGDLMPLDAIAAAFPTTRDRFTLAYAESVSAVDDIVQTYGKPALVSLIRSYASGVTDEEAFKAAIGKGVAAFSDEWLASAGATAPEPFGPASPPPGPVPPDWAGAPAASGGPGAGAAPGSSGAPAATSNPGAGGLPAAAQNPTAINPTGSQNPADLATIVIGGGVIVAIAIVALVALRARRSARRPPPGSPPARWPPAG
jgi:hypothetical protein